MWSDWEEFAEALEGALGEEEQEAALQFAEQSGLLDQWTAQEEAAQAGNYEQALEAEFVRLESQVGRRLTPDEEQGLLDSIPTQQREAFEVPDWSYAVGVLRERDGTEEGRLDRSAAAAERVFNEQAEQDRQRQFAQQTPPQPEPGYDWEGE